MQRIALIGITGRAGSRIADELLARGHRVTGIARDTAGVPARDGLTTVSADAKRREAIAPLLAGHDAVVSAARFDGEAAGSSTRPISPGAKITSAPWLVRSNSPDRCDQMNSISATNEITKADNRR